MSYEYKKWNPNEETTALKEKANSYGTYNESQSVSDLLNKKNEYEANNNPGEWSGGTYGDAVKEAYNAYNNREKFSYDLNGDALYQQYKDKYINQGRLAMADTIGQASAMTGGYGSSYATTAGNQAYQSQLQNLNDIVPQLYQMAYDRYNQEGENLKANYSMLSDMYNTEYGEHRDRVGDYNTNLDRLTNEYNNERSFDYGTWDADRSYYQNAYQNAYNRDYGAHQDEQNRLYSIYRDSVADEQWQKSYDYQVDRDRVSDEQWQKAYDYQASRDEVSDKQWQTSYDYQVSRDAVADSQWKDSFDYQKGRDEVADSQWNQSFQYQKDRDKVSDNQWQKSYELQKEAANKAAVTAESIEGLTDEQIEKFEELYSAANTQGNFDTLKRYILSLPISEAEKAHLTTVWIPEKYRGLPKIEPPKKTVGAKGGGLGDPVMHTLN